MVRIADLHGIAFSTAMLMLFLSTTFTDQRFNQDAYANSGGNSNITGPSTGSITPKLYAKFDPPILLTESKQGMSIQLRFFDANTNVTIHHVTYFIEITKSGKTFMQDLFHAHAGELNLKLNPRQGPVKVFGEKEPTLGGWVENGGPLVVEGPVFLEAGLYHISIKIFGADSDNLIIREEDRPKFDLFYSVGDVFRTQLTYKNQNYNATMISFFDKVKSFNFDQDKRMISWSIPFDWSLPRLASETPIVHQELALPKSLLDLSGKTGSFNATVNGVPLKERNVTVDSFSSNSTVTIYYFLNKSDIVAIAEKPQIVKTDMTFTLFPQSNVTPKTSRYLYTDSGGVQVTFVWIPSNLKANTESIVKINFSDAFSGNSLNDTDILYDLRIIDEQGNEVLSKPDLIAKGATDTQAINFSKNEVYHVELRIKGFIMNGEQTDETREGVARGTVVVPEFPVNLLFITAVGLTGALVALRFKAKLFLS